MSVINRHGIIVTQKLKIPVQEIVSFMCQNRSMARVTARYPLSEQEIWDAVSMYVDTIHSISISDIEIVPFSRQDIASDSYQLAVECITEEMYASITYHGRKVYGNGPDADNLDYMYQVGLHHVIIDVLEFLIDPEAQMRKLDNSEMHFCVLAALEYAYQDDLHSDAGFFIRHMNLAGSPQQETEE